MSQFGIVAMNELEDKAPVVTDLTVSDSVLTTFVDALEKLEGFEEVAPKLRKAFFEERAFSELAIRAALLAEKT